MMQVNSNKQTPAIARDREFLVSLKPEAILWQPLFEGAEIAILSGEPNDGRSPHVALCRGETIAQGHFVGPIDTTVVRPDDDRRNKTVIAESLIPVLEWDF